MPLIFWSKKMEVVVLFTHLCNIWVFRVWINLRKIAAFCQANLFMWDYPLAKGGAKGFLVFCVVLVGCGFFCIILFWKISRDSGNTNYFLESIFGNLNYKEQITCKYSLQTEKIVIWLWISNPKSFLFLQTDHYLVHRLWFKVSAYLFGYFPCHLWR